MRSTSPCRVITCLLACLLVVGWLNAQSPGVFQITSPELRDGGNLPAEYTADGHSSTLPLAWSGSPPQTKSFALIMHHVDPEGIIKWYWILYNIPATASELPKNVGETGMRGNNSVNERPEYAPPQSKGPGPKTYIITLYALDDTLMVNLPARRISRAVLLQTMEGHVLASAELHMIYSRPDNKAGPQAPEPRDPRNRPPPASNKEGRP